MFPSLEHKDMIYVDRYRDNYGYGKFGGVSIINFCLHFVENQGGCFLKAIKEFSTPRLIFPSARIVLLHLTLNDISVI